MVELGEAWGRCSVAANKLAEAISQVGAAMTKLVELWKLEEQRQEEDRQKVSELKLVSKRIVKLSKSKRTKVRKKNMARIRKELRLYEKRRQV